MRNYRLDLAFRTPFEAAAFDPDGQRGFIDLPAVTAPPGMTAMLLDHKRHVVDVDLLDHPGHDREQRLQVMPAPGAEVEAMIEESAVDRFGREGGALVFGAPGLPADAASVLALRRRRLGRLDDVTNRRLSLAVTPGSPWRPGRRSLIRFQWSSEIS